MAPRTTRTKVAREVPREVPRETLIKIERRQVVATIADDPHADHPPLRAAFMAASDYIAEHAGEEHVRVEFEYGGGQFSAGFGPMRGDNLNDVSDERLAEACRNRGMDVYPAA